MTITRKRRAKGKDILLGVPLKIDDIRGTIERRGRERRQQEMRWFHPGEVLGWKKDLPQKKRINIVVRSRGGDYLAAGRTLQALANVTQDRETKEKAGKDAKILFIRHAKGRGALR